jgi:hypothetical protein
MKIQLVTPVAAREVAEKRDLSETLHTPPTSSQEASGNSKSGATSSSGSRRQEPRIKAVENHQRGLTHLIYSMSRKSSGASIGRNVCI